MRIKRTVVSCLVAFTLLGSSASAMSAQATCPPHNFADRVYQQTTSYTRSHIYQHAISGELRTCYYQQYQIHLRVRCAYCGLENGDMVVQDGGQTGHTCGN